MSVKLLGSPGRSGTSAPSTAARQKCRHGSTDLIIQRKLKTHIFMWNFVLAYVFEKGNASLTHLLTKESCLFLPELHSDAEIPSSTQTIQRDHSLVALTRLHLKSASLCCREGRGPARVLCGRGSLAKARPWGETDSRQQ